MLFRSRQWIPEPGLPPPGEDPSDRVVPVPDQAEGLAHQALVEQVEQRVRHWRQRSPSGGGVASASGAPRRLEGGRPRPSRGVRAAGTEAEPRSWKTTQGAQGCFQAVWDA